MTIHKCCVSCCVMLLVIGFDIDMAANSFTYYLCKVVPLLLFQVIQLLKLCYGRNQHPDPFLHHQLKLVGVRHMSIKRCELCICSCAIVFAVA